MIFFCERKRRTESERVCLGSVGSLIWEVDEMMSKRRVNAKFLGRERERE